MSTFTPNILAMNFGGQEMLLVFLVVLLLFGAKKLPQLARGIGKSAGEFKRARAEFENEITRAETEEETKAAKSAVKKEAVTEDKKEETKES